MITRRKLFAGAAALLGGSALAQRIAGGSQLFAAQPTVTPTPRGRVNYRPIVTPNGSSLPWVMKDGVKESVEGDRVRILVTNKLAEPTTVHWHGFILPNGMDGVGGVTQKHIPPGETYVYEFPLLQHGAQMYHPHSDEMTQMAMGMEGFFIIHPKDGYPEPVDRHFVIFLQEWAIPPGTSTPNPNVMVDFDMFTFNSRAWPGTDPLVVKLGDRVRISFANLSMDSHPIHFHGHRWWVVETDGGPIPRSGWWPETTVNIPPGTTRTVEFVADNPGDWPCHCHKNHHAMNAMSHEIPNVIGVDQKGVAQKIGKLVPGYMAMGETGMGGMSEMAEMMPGPRNTLPMMTGTGQFGPIEMGGMFTILKVREGITTYDDPGWYKNPPGTVATSIAGPDSSDKPANEPKHHDHL